jgi:formamidopyrimidine-DNA glycosylase
MTGRLLFLPAAGPVLPHVHITLKLTEGRDLVMQDARRFGRFLIYASGVSPPLLTHVGLEPFSRLLTPAWVMEKARQLKRPIKNFLLDGRMIAGIGNIYACETLFAVRLHPQTPVGQLQAQQWKEIIHASRRILRAAIRQGGTTISDYVNSQGQTGLFHLQLQVYGRTDEPCPRCHTAIARLIQAGRSTFYCPVCQGKHSADSFQLSA